MPSLMLSSGNASKMEFESIKTMKHMHEIKKSLTVLKEITCLTHVRSSISRPKVTKNAGNAAKIAKFISLALRIWLSSSMALLVKFILSN